MSDSDTDDSALLRRVILLRPPPNVEEPVAAEGVRQTSDAEAYYMSNNNDKRTLIVLSIGSEHEINPEADPWKSLQHRDIKPRTKDLQNEVKRRSKDIANPPRPNHWDVNTCMDWLKSNPITAENDLLFIKNEASRIRTMVEDANHESALNDALTQAGQWQGPVPVLRLAHCLNEDDIKPAYLRRNDARTRRELDGRNSADRPLTAYEMIANKWNDVTFNPSSVITNCHPVTHHLLLPQPIP
eukprot:scaffold5960_cov141-Amphora_coffeaeformis.AAC.1